MSNKIKYTGKIVSIFTGRRVEDFGTDVSIRLEIKEGDVTHLCFDEKRLSSIARKNALSNSYEHLIGLYFTRYEDGTLGVSTTPYSDLPQKVTMEHLESIVDKESYSYDETLTICVITTKNGFKVTGESACADPAIYNKADGEKYAKQAAIEKLWPLEGYLLKQRLFDAK